MKDDLLQALAIEINTKSDLDACFGKAKTPGEFSIIKVRSENKRHNPLVISLSDGHLVVFGGQNFDRHKYFELNDPNSIDRLIVHLKRNS